MAYIPSYAHDDHRPTDGTEYQQRIDEQGNVIPEAPHDRADKTVSDLTELQAFEKQIDPAGIPDVYVCANLGDAEVTVVLGQPVEPSDKADLKSGDELGEIVRGEDRCADKSMVVGR
ncbi:hypothetical protein KM427_04090 [Nocardioides sp. LMS-CY]|uniref:hypothetical protein n=1 Tax=Nocardioides sp. (strain LMS-CY) TaxID=2840457 RepID=UPI001BFFDDE2|nr:hypothetical protein [Nocardioides sp. LMS-CY]QWF22927.1 hypothetical protein KM427_04090 [Nocardioides sp. LMS-CY]